ncbi:MAG: ERCC4 domain-containing protein [Candidatus Micrarchaeia archaeon]
MQDSSSDTAHTESQATLAESAFPDTPIVYADTREDRAVIESLEGRGCRVIVKQLEIGDYIVSDRTVIERKTRDDFESSIVDGRLFEQASRITQAYEKVVYVIEGQAFNERVNRKALMAAISSLILNNNISIFFTRDPGATAELICALASKEQLESRRVILLKKPKKHNDLNLSVLYIASAIPMIGEKTAENLLIHFGSLQNLFNATEQQLAEVKGIGKKRAREIAKIMRAKYIPRS